MLDSACDAQKRRYPIKWVTPFVLSSLKLLLRSDRVFINANTCYVTKKRRQKPTEHEDTSGGERATMVAISTRLLPRFLWMCQSIRPIRQYHNTLRAHCPQVPQNGDAPDELPPLSPLRFLLLAYSPENRA